MRVLLAGQSCGALETVDHGQTVEIPGGSLTFYVDDGELNRDSAVLMRAGGASFLNQNDCKAHDVLPTVSRGHGAIDVFTCQFSGATWHPTCYEYPPPVYERLSRAKALGKFEQVARAIETLRPVMYVPSAGPPCFLDPTLIDINFQPVNIFPRSDTLLPWLGARLRNSTTWLRAMEPGDVLDAASGNLEPSGSKPITVAELPHYLRGYADEYAGRFAALAATVAPTDTDRIFGCLRDALEAKLKVMTLADRIPVPLFFWLDDLPHRAWRVNFPRRRIEEAQPPRGAPYYTIHAPAWQVARVLEGHITWEEFALTFRARLRRDPDVYRTELIGFLLLEQDSLSRFCERLEAITSTGARIQVEAPCGKFTVDRYCPHQGGDLSQARVEDGRFLVCPRHRWPFDLEDVGRCRTSNATIHAVRSSGSGDPEAA